MGKITSKVINAFFRGSLAIVPLALSLYLMVWLFTQTEAMLDHLLFWTHSSIRQVPGLKLLIFFTGVVLLGFVLPSRPFAFLFRFLEKQLMRVPLLRSIYSAIQDLMTYFTSRRGQEQVVVVQPEGMDVRLVGLLMRKNLSGLPAEISQGEARVAVFFPMSYQMGGLTVFVPEKWVQTVPMGVDVAMKSALTGWISRKNETPLKE